MSTPTRRHTLAREIERGAGGEYVAARFAQMHCDGAMGTCPIPPERAPRVIVPARHGIASLDAALAGMSVKRQAQAAHRVGAAPLPLYKFTTLHYCRRHWNFAPDVTLDRLLPDTVKRELEQLAKAMWPHGVCPDFERAYIDWVLVTTPEYRAYLLELEQVQGVTFRGVGVL